MGPDRLPEGGTYHCTHYVCVETRAATPVTVRVHRCEDGFDVRDQGTLKGLLVRRVVTRQRFQRFVLRPRSFGFVDTTTGPCLPLDGRVDPKVFPGHYV